jgi:hypothetical protein
MGREILAGGGITPDLEIEGADYADVVYDVARAGLWQEFAPGFLERHPGWQPGDGIDEDEWQRFVELALATDDIDTDAETLEEQRTEIVRGIRREAARRADSDLAAWQVGLEGDLQYQRARELFAEAGTLEQMFKLADGRRAKEASR